MTEREASGTNKSTKTSKTTEGDDNGEDHSKPGDKADASQYKNSES